MNMKKTTYDYDVRISTFSKMFAYIFEIESDEFGITENVITKPLRKEELQSLHDAIGNILTKLME